MAWAKTSRQSRGYGAAHDRMRAKLMATVILCEECTRHDRVTVGTIADHIIPLSAGGTGDRSNYQLLCVECHNVKTAAEGNRNGVAFPQWLPASRIPMVIVCGAPGAGKTTYARQEAAKVRGGYVIDLDEIALRLTGTHGHDQVGADRKWLAAALYERNALLAEAGQAGARGACWFIVSAPTPAERAWWEATLKGDVVLLNPGEHVCRERVGSRRAALVARWYEKAYQPWAHDPSRPRITAGVDRSGRPTDPSHPWNRR